MRWVAHVAIGNVNFMSTVNGYFFLEGGNVIFDFFLEGISEYPVDFLKMS